MSVQTAAICRAKQLFIRIRRQMRPVRMPTAADGGGAIWTAAQLLRSNGLSRPLLVLGRDAGPWGDRLRTALTDGDIPFAVCKTAGTATAEAERICAERIRGGCDCFIAVGGPDTLCAAKLAAARAARPGKTLPELEGYGRVRRKTPPLVAVPTATGSGAESLAWADALDEDGRRLRIEDPALTPTFAVLDPELLTETPRAAVARCAIDGLCLAAEAYLSRFGSDESRAAAREAVKAFLEAAEPCWNSGGTLARRSRLLEASRLAGFAASVGGYGYARALADAVSDVTGVPSTDAIAALLPVVLEKYGNRSESALSSLADAAELEPNGTQAQRAAALIERIRVMVFRMDLPDSLAPMDADTAARIGALASADANPRCACPVVWSARELCDVLRDAVFEVKT